MAPRQHIAFEPSFERVLAEHLHYTPVQRQISAISIFRLILCQPGLLRCFVDRLQLVRSGLIRAEDAKTCHVPPHHVAQEMRQHFCRRYFARCRLIERLCIAAKIRQVQRLPQQSAIRMRICADPSIALGRQRAQILCQPARFVEQLLRFVTPHPLLDLLQVSWILLYIEYRDLVRSPESFHFVSVDFFRAGPPFR